MNKIEKLKVILSNQYSLDKFKFEYRFGDNTIELPKEDVFSVIKFLKEVDQCDYLVDICGVDYPQREKRFEVVYHLLSTSDLTRIRIKTRLGVGEAVDSVIPIWRSADWFEREAWDMFGIHFKGNANLRRILTHHQFKGHPLRKDYDANLQQPCTESLPIHFDVEPEFDTSLVREGFMGINIGPSHPAMHGTLRLMAELDGETIVRANVEIGYLHRCFEKMAETHPYNQVIPFTDRLNYCSPALNNVAYCKTVEKLMGVEIPPRAQAMRVIISELSRIIDHIVAIGTGGVDLGALTAFFMFFVYREKVYNLFEKLCGSRLTVTMTRVGGMSSDVPEGWFDDLNILCKELRQGIDEIDKLLSNNKIFIQRTRGVGCITPEEALQWGWSGPLLRSTGLSLDVRKMHPYYGYETFDFDIPIGSCGDLYDRYLVRMEEMRQSIRIIEQVARHMPGGDYTIRDKSIVLPEKKDVYGNIEGLMNHFMLVVKGLRPPVGEIYDCVEGANGELGFYLVSDGGACPYRLKVRAPCFPIYQSFPHVIRGGLISDAVATVASMNIIAGELDR